MTSLAKSSLHLDPLQQFSDWFSQYEALEDTVFPDAVCLSTVSPEGRPEGRIVLLKGYDTRGFRFFTNSNSRKGKHLAECPFAAMTFYWDRLGKQVRIEGRVEVLPSAETDTYFATRPRGSQIAAWASSQSEALESKEALMRRVEEIESKYAEETVPRPPHWNGYQLSPERFEFWQSAEFRLHDRFEYTPKPKGGWLIKRLNP